MKHSRIGRTLVILLCVSLLCQMLVGLSACAATEDALYETQITSVQLNRGGERVSISATLSKDDAVLYKNRAICLFALEPFQPLSAVVNGSVQPLTESRSAESMHFTVDFLFDYGRRTRLTQRFLLASRDENGVCTPITEAVYLSNPEVLSVGSAPSGGDSLKGVAISTADDVTLLSPAHTVIDLPIEEYILSVPKSVDTISYLYAGETLSLSETAVEALDEQVKRLTATGSRIYLRPLLVTSPDALGDLSPIGYVGSAESGAYAMNLGNEDGYFYIAGFLSFLAERYNSVSGVIPGVVLNDPQYNGTTAATFEGYMENVLSLMRVTYNIFRSKHSGVRVYLPVSNLFTTDGALGVTEKGTRDFLGAFASYAKKSGDFDWSLYLLMRLPSAASDAIYQESGTVNDDGVTEKYVLPQTLSTLLEFLSSDELKYGNAERLMLWGLSVAGSGDVGAENQRMSLLYAYMKALQYNTEKKNAAVQAVIWETLTDSETSSHGLLSLDGVPKPSGELFSLLGRADLSSTINLSAAEVKLGARYAEIASVLSSNSEQMLTYSGTLLGEDAIPSHAQPTLIFGDGAGWGNAFSPLPGTGAVSVRRQHYDTTPLLVATFESGIGCGIYTSEISASQLKDREIFALTVTSALPEGYKTATVRVTLAGHSDSRFLRYTGEGTVTDGVWSTMRFDITDFASELGDGKLTLTVSLIHTGANADATATFYLSKVESLETQNWFMRGGWIVFFVIVLLVALTVLVIWFFQTYEVRWTPGGERGKRGADQKSVSFKDRLARMRRSFAEHTEVRRKSRSRIMVKPGTDGEVPASKTARDTEESDGFEALEDLFEEPAGSSEDELSAEQGAEDRRESR